MFLRLYPICGPKSRANHSTVDAVVRIQETLPTASWMSAHIVCFFNYYRVMPVVLVSVWSKRLRSCSFFNLCQLQTSKL